MRPDMSKVVVERPRLYRYRKTKHFRAAHEAKVDPESAPVKEPMRSKRERTKQFNEHLQPLRRWLLKQVGRPWDKVKSEAIKGLGGSKGTLQDHVLTHLKGYVDENVTLIKGIPHTISYGGLRPIVSSYNKHYQQLYCCPKTGLLRVAKAPTPVKAERFEIHRLGEYRVAMYFRGCWYEVTTKTFPFMSNLVKDAYLEKEITRAEAERLWGKEQYAVTLRALRKEEIRSLPFSTK